MIETHRRLCSAHRTYDGQPCTRSPIRGGDVCIMHGGKAPQVKRSAAERLETFVDPALTQLAHLMEWADNDAVKLAAVKDILDRAGYKPREKIELNVQTLKTIDQSAWDAV